LSSQHRAESVINTVFHRNNWGELVKWIQDYEDAFTELALLGQKTWNDDEIKKLRSVQNAQNIVIVDTVFEELVSDNSFIETCHILRSHAIRLDQKYKEKAARQIHNASQLSNRAKKDKVKKILALINQIQIQDSCSSDEESVAVPPNKTAMLCKLAQIPPEIWMTLPLEAKKWDDKMKKSLSLSKSTAVPNDKETNNSNMPNQYARVKNVANGEDVIKDNIDQTYGFVDEFLEEAIKCSRI
jgi:beta-glucosidase-like glycosyl hydrolase